MKTFRFLGILFSLTACTMHPAKKNALSAVTPKKGEAPYMYFKEDIHDFGKIIQGEKVSYTFVMENKGKSDLVLNYVVASCGCTVAKWTRKPIPYGHKANIEVTFDSTGKIGLQNKTISVRSNADPDNKTLTIRCEVVTPDNNSKTE